MRKSSLLALLLIAASPMSVQAASAPDPVTGRKFAQVECGMCHFVEEQKGKMPPPRVAGAAPHFKIIALDPALTAEKIRQTLRLPHGSMDNVLLAEKDVDNIVSYIEGLRTP